MSEFRESTQAVCIWGYEYESQIECHCGNVCVHIDAADGAEATCNQCGRRYQLEIRVLEAPALAGWQKPVPVKQDPLTRFHVTELLRYLGSGIMTLRFDRFFGPLGREGTDAQS